MQDQVKKNLKPVNYVGIAAMTLLLAGTLAFGIYPQYKEGQADIRLTAEKKAAFERAEALRPIVQAAQREVELSQKRLADAEQRMPKGQPDNQFSKELNEVAKAAGIRVEKMPPMGKPQPEGPYNSILVSVEGTGDWDSCVRFLKGISSMNRISRLDSVVVDTESEAATTLGGRPPLCHIVVKFSTFYLEP